MFIKEAPNFPSIIDLQVVSLKFNNPEKTLLLDSKDFKNGIEKKMPYEKMKEYYFITEEVATEYIKQLNIFVNCDATEIDIY